MLRPIRTFVLILLFLSVQACERPSISQSVLKNPTAREHAFLTDMYADDYFPEDLVDKSRDILVELCYAIEIEQPKEVKGLYPITHYFTKRFNALQGEFEQNGSEIETAAREAIAQEFAFIAEAYGFQADVEELIAPREW